MHRSLEALRNRGKHDGAASAVSDHSDQSVVGAIQIGTGALGKSDSVLLTGYNCFVVEFGKSHSASLFHVDAVLSGSIAICASS